MNQHLVTVDFHGDTIFAVRMGDQIFVAVKPICASLGIDRRSQQERINSDPVLSEGGVTITLPSPGGCQETFCLRLDLLNGWLFKIDTRRIPDPDVREKVMAYQRECYRVLHDHFFGRGPAAAEDFDGPIPEPQYDLDREQVTLALRLVREVRLIFGLAAARAMWARLPLPQPPLADAADPSFFGTGDPVEAFLATCIVPAPGTVRPRQMFYDAYCAWAAASGETPVSMIGFGIALKRRFHVSDRRVTGADGKRVWCYGGIDLDMAETASAARAGAVH
jgi:hypothetical protein